MNITDIIALAKAGYKPADIREFLAEEKTPDPKPAPGEDQTAGHDLAAPDDPPAVSQDDATAGPDDYTKQIEELTEANNKLMEQLKNLQEANSRAAQAAEDKKSDQDILNDMARSFM